MKFNKIKKIKGGIFKDKRGQVSFVNGFTFKDIKRFYQVENIDQKYIRAFHGHQTEAKYVYVVSGAILLCAVYLDNLKFPSKKNKVQRFILSDKKPEIVYIPPKYANGFKALRPNTKVIFFSTSKLEESLEDDYRFPPDYWGQKVWEK